MINYATIKALDSRYKQYNASLPELCDKIYAEFGKRYTPEQLNYVIYTIITYIKDYIETHKNTALRIRIQNFGTLKLVGQLQCRECKRGSVSRRINEDGSRTITCRKCNASWIKYKPQKEQ